MATEIQRQMGQKVRQRQGNLAPRRARIGRRLRMGHSAASQLQNQTANLQILKMNAQQLAPLDAADEGKSRPLTHAHTRTRHTSLRFVGKVSGGPTEKGKRFGPAGKSGTQATAIDERSLPTESSRPPPIPSHKIKKNRRNQLRHSHQHDRARIKNRPLRYQVTAFHLNLVLLLSRASTEGPICGPDCTTSQPNQRSTH